MQYPVFVQMFNCITYIKQVRIIIIIIKTSVNHILIVCVNIHQTIYWSYSG